MFGWLSRKISAVRFYYRVRSELVRKLTADPVFVWGAECNPPFDRLMAEAVDHLRRSEDPTWDRNAQAYLALAALYAAQGDLDPSRRDPAMAQALDAMLARLQFRGDTNSPPQYRVESLDGLLSAIRPRAAIEE